MSVVRDEAKGQAAAATIRESVPKADIEIAVLDLFDLDSVRRGTAKGVAGGGVGVVGGFDAIAVRTLHQEEQGGAVSLAMQFGQAL